MFAIILLALQLCTQAQTEHVGTLPPKINEASGVALSRLYPGRIYHINDSGGAGVVYVTDLAGEKLRTIDINGFRPVDTEDLRLAGCGNRGQCLFVGDIGDNDRKRKAIEIVVVREPSQLDAKVPIERRIRLQYPDGAHDSESFAIHPNGTIFLLTKGGNGVERLFTLSQQKWLSGGDVVHTLSPAGRVDFKAILPGADPFGILPTSIDVSDDGKRLLVLTYRDAVEFAVDIQKAEPLSNPRVMKLQFLMQQESVAYVPGESSFIYTSEHALLPAWIMKARCGK
jgi:hypothetical protein